MPPGIWFGFQGKANGMNLLMNLGDMEHDADELKRRSISTFDYDWASN